LIQIQKAQPKHTTDENNGKKAKKKSRETVAVSSRGDAFLIYIAEASSSKQEHSQHKTLLG
jgi:hypothetical protein